MAYASIRQGRVIYILEVTGIGVFSTDAIDLSGEGWFLSAGYSTAKPWLVFDVDDLSERIDFATSEFDVGSIGFIISDKSGQATALTKDGKTWTHTWLTATVDEDETTTIHVVDASTFPGSGTLCIGQERITYTGKTATTLTGLTRGVYATIAAEHYCYLGHPEAPIQPLVSAGPSAMAYRRALLRVAVIDEGTGSPGTSEVLYRGRVTKNTRIGRGRHALTLEHLSLVLKDSIATELPTTVLQQCYWFNGVGETWGTSCVRIQQQVAAHGTLYTDNMLPAEGSYNATTLQLEVNEKLNELTRRTFGLYQTADRVHLHVIEGSVGFHTYIHIRKGDPLWALGFDPMTHFVANSDNDWDHTAENAPRWCVVDFAAITRVGVSFNPLVYVEDASQFVDDTWVAVKGMPACQIEDIPSGLTQLRLDGESVDQTPSHPAILWAVEEEKDATIQQCYHSKKSLSRALREALALQTVQTDPDRWLANGLIADDIDWDELDDIMHGVAPVLKYVRTVVKEPTFLWDMIGPHFALLGICPRITTEGRIGFTQLSDPIASDAISVALDEDLWALKEAASVEGRSDGAPPVAEIIVRYGRDYRGAGAEDIQEWRDPLTFIWREGASLLGKSRSLTYECPGLWPGPTFSVTELRSALQELVTFAHFSTMGRESSCVEIPCVRTSRQVRCGDVVSITHEIAPDIIEGDIGLSGRLGVVVGRRHRVTDTGVDTLIVRLGPLVNSGGIAPCALLDSDDSDDTGTASYTERYAPSGEKDFDCFSVGDNVRLIKQGTTSAQMETTEITAINPGAGTVTFADAVFAPAGIDMPTPCYMVSDSWDAATTAHKTYAFHADSAATPSLGTGSDAAMNWVI